MAELITEILYKINSIVDNAEINGGSMEQDIELTEKEFEALKMYAIKMDKESKEMEAKSGVLIGNLFFEHDWHHTPILPDLMLSSKRIFPFRGFQFKIKINN